MQVKFHWLRFGRSIGSNIGRSSRYFSPLLNAYCRDHAIVLVDPHIEGLLIFPHSNEFHRYWLVEQRYLILQDKASCLPACLLAPPPGSHVFDTCAAPGMKTSHVSAILGGTG
ncbi:hypothetical protein OSTOST_14551 [Ostertagia ostertagi]